MATLEDIGADSGAGNLPPFVDAEGKAELANSQFPFYVVDGTPKRSGAYGDQTFYVVKFGTPGKTTKTQSGETISVTAPGWGANAEAWTLAFDANDDRVEQMQKIKEALAVGDNGFIGPCFLHAIPTRKGNTYFKIRGTRDENPHAIAPPSNGGSSSTQTKPATDVYADDSDEIPFAYDSTFRVAL